MDKGKKLEETCTETHPHPPEWVLRKIDLKARKNEPILARLQATSVNINYGNTPGILPYFGRP